MSRAQLEDSLRRDPDDERAWSVFGDLLAAEGDSRGELIALEQRAAACERPFERQLLEHQADELRQRDHREWLGPLADAGLELTWVRGFLRSIAIGRNHATTLAALRELPTAALLREIVLVRPTSLDRLVPRLEPLCIERLVVRSATTPESRQLRSLAPLAALEQLRELEIVSASIADVGALASLPALAKLSLRRFRGDLEGLGEGFASLRELELSARESARTLGVEALDPLAHFTELRSLSLRDGGWFALEPLAGLRALERLDLRSTGVSDLAPLRQLTRLRALELGGCPLSNLEPLADLPALERLDLAYTKVRQLRPLASLAALRELDLAGTSVRDLEPLCALSRLRKLGLEACAAVPPKDLLEREGLTILGYRAPQPSWQEIAERGLRDLRERR